MRPIDERDEGFEKLYAREYEPMLRVAFLLLDSADGAQEATHDAFAKVYERWRRIDDHGAYLRTCVVNRCRDLQRRGRLERQRTPDPTSTYEELGARELLDALAALPIKQRAAVVLRYYEGLSEAETAARSRHARRHREVDREPSAHPTPRGGGAMTLIDPTFDAFEHRLGSELAAEPARSCPPTAGSASRPRDAADVAPGRAAGWRGRRLRAHRRNRRVRPSVRRRRQRPLRRRPTPAGPPPRFPTAHLGGDVARAG